MEFRGTQIEVDQLYMITTHWQQKYEVQMLYIEKDYFYLKYFGKPMPLSFANSIENIREGEIFILPTVCI